MLRHLRGRRNQLEGALVAALTGVAQGHDDSPARLRAQLVDVQELIRSYESQMAQICAMFVDIADLVEKAEHTLRQFVLPPDA